MKNICITLLLSVFLTIFCCSAKAANVSADEPKYDLGHGWVYGVDYVDSSDEIFERVKKLHRFEYIDTIPEITSNIKTIDVSPKGDLVITTNDYYILVINENGKYKYGYKFNYNGEYGAIWSKDGNNIVYCYAKSDTAYVLDKEGKIIKSYNFTNQFLESTNRSYWLNEVDLQRRQIDNYTYNTDYIKEQGSVSQIIYRVDDNGNREDIYTLSIQKSSHNLIVFALSLLIGAVILFSYLKQKKQTQTLNSFHSN